MRAFLLALLLLASGWASAQNTIVAYEYWFDQADAVFERERVNIQPAASIALSNETIDVTGLSIGHHTLHYRLLDAQDQWSGVLRRSFTIRIAGPYEITGGEYWFDQNDSSPSSFSVSPGQHVDVAINPPAVGLLQGTHRIHYRLRDNHGYWSAVLHRTFTVLSAGPHELVLLRYWSDPSAQNPTDMTEVPIDPNVQYLDIIDDVLFCDWSQTGNTEVFFQLKDNHTQWSSVISRTFDIDAVTGPPGAPGSVSGNTTPTEGSSPIYTVASVPGASYYVWTLPNGWTGVSNTNTIVVTVGTYMDDGLVTVVAGNGCGVGDTSALFVDVGGVSIPSLSTSDVRLFPNPTNGEAWVVNEGSTAIDHILMLNSMGQVIYDERPIPTDRYTLDLSNAANGLYTVRISQGTNTTTLPVMVQH